ncbi:MAG: hypothetical protein KJO07_16210 [Deltaproteobacteria bacterium]|jgi:hypothetical protein|nr:hypothetical protein [Deltaproteobacteria bacterium]
MAPPGWQRLVFTAVLLAACGGAKRGSEPAGHLQITAARLQAGDSVISLHFGGRVDADGQPIGTLHNDGRLVAASGSVIATLGKDGRVTNATGYVLDDVTIDGAGALTFQGRTLTVRDDGTVSGAEGLRVEVAPAGRRAAMFVLLVAALSGT